MGISRRKQDNMALEKLLNWFMINNPFDEMSMQLIHHGWSTKPATMASNVLTMLRLLEYLFWKRWTIIL